MEIWLGWAVHIFKGLEIQFCWRFDWVGHFVGLETSLCRFGWDGLVICSELAGLEIWLDFYI